MIEVVETKMFDSKNRFFSVVMLFAFLFCGVGTSQAQSPSPTPVVHKEIKRWFDFEAINVATRYRYVEANAGASTSAQQYQVVARGRFKFDSKDIPTIYSRAV